MDSVSPSQPISLTKEQLSEVVTAAVDAATDRVARRDRWLMAAIAAICSAIVSCAIAIPVTLELSSDAAHTASLNAKRNCKNISKLAQVEESSFRESQAEIKVFEHQSSDTLGLSQSEFEGLLAAGERREMVRIANLQAIAATDCSANVARTPEVKLPNPTVRTPTSRAPTKPPATRPRGK
jgi:hypothetical protein